VLALAGSVVRARGRDWDGGIDESFGGGVEMLWFVPVQNMSIVQKMRHQNNTYLSETAEGGGSIVQGLGCLP
jgi:hypothetical protein